MKFKTTPYHFDLLKDSERLASFYNAILEYDVEDKLGRIKAKSLFISTENDIYFTPKFDLDPLKKLVKDSKIVLLNTEFDFGDDYKEYRMAEEDIGNFLKQFKE